MILRGAGEVVHAGGEVVQPRADGGEVGEVERGRVARVCSPWPMSGPFCTVVIACARFVRGYGSGSGMR